MIRAVYAGSFDPITNGHVDVIERAAKLFKEMIVVVSHNPYKKYLLTLDERVTLVREAVATIPNVRVVSQQGGLTVQAVRQLQATVLIRGVRNASDLELEQTLDYHNHQLAEELETVVLLTNSKWRFVSSTMVKELATYGGDYQDFVPKAVYQLMEAKVANSVHKSLTLQEWSEE